MEPETEEALAVYASRPEVIAAVSRVKSGNYTSRDIALVIPLIPEFRDSMRKAENARAEGRVISQENAMGKLEELDEGNRG